MKKRFLIICLLLFSFCLCGCEFPTTGVTLPNLMGKSQAECKEILDSLNLKYEFKKYLNQTIINFFNEQKVNRASFLLMNTNFNILDIANMVGYSSPKNFINQFTKRFSLSPSAWRAKNQCASKK